MLGDQRLSDSDFRPGDHAPPLAGDINKFSQAIDLYTKAIEINGDNDVYWANRAFAYTKLEEYGSAIQDASKTVDIDPKNSKASTDISTCPTVIHRGLCKNTSRYKNCCSLGLTLSKEIKSAIFKQTSSISRLGQFRTMMEINYMLSFAAAESSILLLHKYNLLEILLPFQAAYMSQEASRSDQSSMMLML
ncbi:hypothetical protein L2E82_40378 [Cichorium intybus]|uniref:Uncharacterized protein n=1 Tax=Cichorium intybus TaxID=13427 RepID=A0ACB9AK42_CICIN|nr:hypothetical protein L2E82_40378 [Cichorium intybus]